MADTTQWPNKQNWSVNIGISNYSSKHGCQLYDLQFIMKKSWTGLNLRVLPKKKEDVKLEISVEEVEREPE